ncbi:MAG: CBS domain-containing protein [Dehalococcoidales bacterium]|nr:CBS domain-containing protein [Dehalococcoidales bacterium]
MKVRDIGVKETYCASPSTNLSEVASMMKKDDIGIVPVCEGKKVLGVITDRDIVIRCVAADVNPKDCNAREFMTAPAKTVSSHTEIEEAAAIMGREQIRRLPVVEEGNLVGMISLGDIATALNTNDALVAQTLRKISTTSHAFIA